MAICRCETLIGHQTFLFCVNLMPLLLENFLGSVHIQSLIHSLLITLRDSLKFSHLEGISVRCVFRKLNFTFKF